MKYGANLKFEIIIQKFRKLMTLNVVNICKSYNEYFQKQI